jgi:hypothetical protein
MSTDWADAVPARASVAASESVQRIREFFMYGASVRFDYLLVS